MIPINPIDFFDKIFDSKNVDSIESDFEYDYRTSILGGTKYLFEFAKVYQPRFYDLIKMAEVKVGLVDKFNIFANKTIKNHYCFLELNGLYLRLHPYFINSSYEVSGTSKRISALPEGFRKSYYWRTDGVTYPSEPLGSLYSWMMNDSSGGWRTFEDIARTYQVLNWKDSLRRWVPDSLNYEEVNKNFLCFLNARLTGPIDSTLGSGDQLFVNVSSDTGDVYHLHNGCVNEPRILTNPLEAVDEYMANVLTNKEVTFDFSAYSVKL